MAAGEGTDPDQEVVATAGEEERHTAAAVEVAVRMAAEAAEAAEVAVHIAVVEEAAGRMVAVVGRVGD